jgi:hypothetical protein
MKRRPTTARLAVIHLLGVFDRIAAKSLRTCAEGLGFLRQRDAANKGMRESCCRIGQHFCLPDYCPWPCLRPIVPALSHSRWIS